MKSSFLSRLMTRIKGLAFQHLPMMISCREFEAFVMAYSDGDLPNRQRIIFEFHLKMCRECRDYLAAYQRTIDVAKTAFEDADAPVPADVPEDLVKAILAARRKGDATLLM